MVAIPVLAMAGIVVDGLTDNVHQSDVAIVLGNTVMPDGYPSPWLQARLDRAASLYNAGKVANVIVSGAPHPNTHDEAEAMRSYLVCKGVPAARIVADHGGIHTMETARDSAAIMKARGWKSATVVSQYYHITRSRMALKAFGVRPVYTAHAYRFEWGDLIAIPRELAANVSYRWRLFRSPPPR
ncbi:MAG: YdcF family protein [Alphaproteobacteria bacterium]